MFDFSKNISLNLWKKKSLTRLKMDYVDAFTSSRPDTLVEPEK